MFVLVALAPPEGGSGFGALDGILPGLSGLVATGALTYGVPIEIRSTGREPE